LASEGSKRTLDSFIFLFDDYRNVKSGKIGRIINIKCAAIRCFNEWGPVFGEYNLKTRCNDLSMNPNGDWSSMPSSYPDLYIPSEFDIDDYEVFQIVRSAF